MVYHLWHQTCTWEVVTLTSILFHVATLGKLFTHGAGERLVMLCSGESMAESNDSIMLHLWHNHLRADCLQSRFSSSPLLTPSMDWFHLFVRLLCICRAWSFCHFPTYLRYICFVSTLTTARFAGSSWIIGEVLLPLSIVKHCCIVTVW